MRTQRAASLRAPTLLPPCEYFTSSLFGWFGFSTGVVIVNVPLKATVVLHVITAVAALVVVPPGEASV